MDKENILYIDDDESGLALFKAYFEEVYNVFITAKTSEARQLMQENQIKVVVTDLIMPEENGADFIESMSKIYSDVFYIILTSHTDLEFAIKTLNKGNTFRYIMKPWNFNEFQIIINTAVYSYNIAAENKKLIHDLKQNNALLEDTLTQLKERETQFLNIFQASSDAIIIFDFDKKILLANPGFYNFVKVPEGTLITITDLLKGKQLENFEKRLSELSENKRVPIFEYQIVSPEGEVKFIEVNSTLISYFGQNAVLSVIRNITQRKQMSQQILSEVVQAEDRERKRIATDLHDGLGPMMSTINMYIEWMSDKSRKDDIDEILSLSGKTIKEAISQLQTISYNLSPHLLEKFGLNAATQSLIDSIKTSYGCNFRFQSNLKDRLPLKYESALFRVIKECINNTQKHAKAKESFISLYVKNELLYFDYSDNGSGFDFNAVKNVTKGMGLYNIQNRIQSLGGESEIISEPGKGVKIKALIRIL